MPLARFGPLVALLLLRLLLPSFLVVAAVLMVEVVPFAAAGAGETFSLAWK